MAMNKAIKSGKEHRVEYKYKSNYCKSVDRHCQNHGGRRHQWECSWCYDNRTRKNHQKDKIAKEELQKFYK